MNMIKYVLLMVFSVAVASVSQVMLKTSSNRVHQSFLKEYCNVLVISGYGLLALSTVLTLLAFRGLEFKNAPVLESMGYVFILILSRLFLKEKITGRKLLGNLIILAGILIFYLK